MHLTIAIPPGRVHGPPGARRVQPPESRLMGGHRWVQKQRVKHNLT
jgi:hypothetical protein